MYTTSSVHCLLVRAKMEFRNLAKFPTEGANSVDDVVRDGVGGGVIVCVSVSVMSDDSVVDTDTHDEKVGLGVKVPCDVDRLSLWIVDECSRDCDDVRLMVALRVALASSVLVGVWRSVFVSVMVADGSLETVALYETVTEVVTDSVPVIVSVMLPKSVWEIVHVGVAINVLENVPASVNVSFTVVESDGVRELEVVGDGVADGLEEVESVGDAVRVALARSSETVSEGVSDIERGSAERVTVSECDCDASSVSEFMEPVAVGVGVKECFDIDTDGAVSVASFEGLSDLVPGLRVRLVVTERRRDNVFPRVTENWTDDEFVSRLESDSATVGVSDTLTLVDGVGEPETDGDGDSVIEWCVVDTLWDRSFEGDTVGGGVMVEFTVALRDGLSTDRDVEPLWLTGSVWEMLGDALEREREALSEVDTEGSLTVMPSDAVPVVVRDGSAEQDSVTDDENDAERPDIEASVDKDGDAESEGDCAVTDTAMLSVARVSVTLPVADGEGDSLKELDALTESVIDSEVLCVSEVETERVPSSRDKDAECVAEFASHVDEGEKVAEKLRDGSDVGLPEIVPTDLVIDSDTEVELDFASCEWELENVFEIVCDWSIDPSNVVLFVIVPTVSVTDRELEKERVVETLASPLPVKEGVVDTLAKGVMDVVGVWLRDTIGALWDDDIDATDLDAVELSVQLLDAVAFDDERSNV
jgi:hypothetical protein